MSGHSHWATTKHAKAAADAKKGKIFSRIAKEIMHNRRIHEDVHRIVKGMMVESYIEDGCQSVGGSVYGQSITDPCLGWEKSERLIYDLAEMA